MGILTVSYDGVSCTPMRPEDPDKNYGSADVPSGTNAVITAAADHIARNYDKSCAPARLDMDAQESKLTTLKGNLSAVESYTDPDEESKFVLDRSEVLNPTADEVQARIDSVRGFTDDQAQQACDEYNHPQEGEEAPDPQRTLDEQKDLLRKKNGRIDEEGNILSDPTEMEASDVIVEERKTNLAEDQLDKIMKDNLEVPLSPEEVSSGTCTIASDGVTITDSSGSFVADGVQEDDLVKVAGYVVKVSSVTSETELVAKKVAKEITEAASYSILRDSFMSQFEFSTVEEE